MNEKMGKRKKLRQIDKLVLIYCILSVLMFISLFVGWYIVIGIGSVLMGVATFVFRYKNDRFLSNRDWSIVIFELIVGVIIILIQ